MGDRQYIFVRKTNLIYLIACAVAIQCAVTAWGQANPTPAPPVYTITTVAGNGSPGSTGDGGSATSAELFLPYAAFSAGGNLYIADQVNSRLRIVSGGTINTFAGNGTQGYSGDNSQATKAEMFDPTGLTVDSTGNVYVSDNRNQVIRKITTGGIISTYAGNQSLGAGLSGDTGTATNAQLFNPAGLALDKAGNLYIADEANAKIRIVFASGANAGSINTFAGNFVEDYAGDNGPAINAEMNNPHAVAVDAQGNVYIADTDNHRIREVTLDGVMHTVAGTGNPGHTGDGGQATSAELNHPEGIAVDSAGNLYIADSFNQCIRMVTTTGVIYTIAGQVGKNGLFGDGGPALQATLNFPASVSVDSKGNLFVADSQNNVIRELVPAAPASQATPTVLSNGVITWSEFGGFQTGAAAGSWIEIYGNNLAADTRIWAPSDFSGNTAPMALDGTTVKIAGMPAFVYYVSPGLVNALLPSNVPLGTQPLTVTNSAGTSTSVNVNVQSTLPGLYDPGMVVNGNPFLAATFSDMSTYVAPPGSISGFTSARAHPGDTIVFFGIGFGPVTPAVNAGSISFGDTALTAPVQFFFNGTPAAAVTYAGIAPGSVALYEFEVTVPTIPSSDAVEITFTLGGVPGTQTLYTSVQNTGPQKRPTGLTGPNRSIR